MYAHSMPVVGCHHCGHHISSKTHPLTQTGAHRRPFLSWVNFAMTRTVNYTARVGPRGIQNVAAIITRWIAIKQDAAAPSPLVQSFELPYIEYHLTYLLLKNTAEWHHHNAVEFYLVQDDGNLTICIGYLKIQISRRDNTLVFTIQSLRPPYTKHE